MSDVTDADRERAADVLAGYRAGPGSITDAIAKALAEERTKARAPFLALAQGLDQLADESAGALVGAAHVVRGCAQDIRRAAGVERSTAAHESPSGPLTADDVFERPPWCGTCDEWTRKVEVEIDGRDAMQNCTRCHPLAVAS